MQHAADGIDAFEGQGDNLAAIVSDLIALVGQVETGIDLIESAIARAIDHGDHESSDVIVLDDLTPQYLKASTALGICRGNLDVALQCLLEAGVSAQRPVCSARTGTQPAFCIAR
ncbi:MAG: hypothetical protein JOZ74_11330 [Bradyrhizobium sp.]|nr:hypothetical protein [Bradyrhizobium sp.]